MLIDTHCHMEKVIRDDGEAAVLQRMREAGVGRCITIGTDPQDWGLYRKIASQHRGTVDWTVGLHPGEVTEGWEDAVSAVASYFATDPVPVALGEIGLDYFHLPRFPDEAAELRLLQQAAFRQQLSIAYQLDCPVVVHSRNAVLDCVRLIDESGVDWRKVVFHCFTDGPDRLQPILERGGRASFTGIITYKAASANPIRDAARLQGLERLMLETDAPYLSPEPVRGRPNEPANICHIAAYASALFGVDVETIARFTTRNATTFFALS